MSVDERGDQGLYGALIPAANQSVMGITSLKMRGPKVQGERDFSAHWPPQRTQRQQRRAPLSFRIREPEQRDFKKLPHCPSAPPPYNQQSSGKLVGAPCGVDGRRRLPNALFVARQ
jgi:hypothetical protein